MERTIYDCPFFYFCKVRTLLTYWLLLSMLFLVTPKEWHHDHAKHHQKHASHETSMDESCFTCDFDLAQLNASLIIPQGLFIVNYPNTYFQFAQSYEIDSAIDLKGRAPPSFS